MFSNVQSENVNRKAIDLDGTASWEAPPPGRAIADPWCGIKSFQPPREELTQAAQA